MPADEIIPDDILPEELDDAACLRALAVIVEVGTALVRECQTSSPGVSLADRSRAYERVTLALRRTILLYQHLKSEFVSASERAIRARKAIIREVEDTIERKADPADAGALRVELVERLDSPDFTADLAHRRPADLIRELCNDLGLITTFHGRPQHRRRTPDDIAILCAQAATLPRPARVASKPVEPLRSPLPLAGEGWVRMGPPSQASPPEPGSMTN